MTDDIDKQTGEAPEHLQHDAILMSFSALAVMADVRYQLWRMYYAASRNPKLTEDDRLYYAELMPKDSAVLRRLCELIDDAMQYIGDVNSNTDAVDDHGMTDAAFAAMDRALGRGETK